VFKRNKFLFLSIFAHLIVIYIVVQSVIFPSVLDSPPKKSEVIQAILIFDLPPKTPEPPVDIIEEEKPQLVEPLEELLVVEKPADSEIKTTVKSEVQYPPITPPLQTSQPELAEDKLQELPEEPEQNDDMNDILIKDKNIAAKPNSEIHTPSASMARRHLNSFNKQQQKRMAEQASRNYQQHKNSPIIDAEVKNPFMTEDEKLRDSLKVRADCSSTSKQTTAVLLGFMGAKIDCSKPPPISGFIQNRINKQSHLPGQYRQEDQKRPQSVVIKKAP
jgi:hypothetical protein